MDPLRLPAGALGGEVVGVGRTGRQQQRVVGCVQLLGIDVLPHVSIGDELDPFLAQQIDATVEFSPYWLSGPRYPALTPPDAPIVAAVRRARISAGLPDADVVGLPVWADMCVLDRAGIPAINIGPGGPPYNWADEYVTVDDYLTDVRVYAAAIEEFCNEEG